MLAQGEGIGIDLGGKILVGEVSKKGITVLVNSNDFMREINQSQDSSIPLSLHSEWKTRLHKVDMENYTPLAPLKRGTITITHFSISTKTQ